VLKTANIKGDRRLDDQYLKDDTNEPKPNTADKGQTFHVRDFTGELPAPLNVDLFSYDLSDSIEVENIYRDQE